jgi:hypothetical protein
LRHWGKNLRGSGQDEDFFSFSEKLQAFHMEEETYFSLPSEC